MARRIIPEEEQKKNAVNAAAQPVQADTTPAGVDDVNVQSEDTELIDDVKDGESNTSTKKKPINSLDDASNAFLAMLNQKQEKESSTEPTAKESTEESADENAEAEKPTAAPKAEEPEQADTTESNKEPEAEPKEPDKAVSTLDEAKIMSMINDAVKKEINSGNLSNLSAADIAAKLKADEPPKAEVEEDEFTVEELPDLDSDEFYNEFTDDPAKAIDRITDIKANRKYAEIMKELAPIRRQNKIAKENQEILDVLRAFASEYPDFGEYTNDMVKILKDGDYSKTDRNAYRNAYQTAKNNKLAAQLAEVQQQLAESEGKAKSLDDYLADSDSFEKLKDNDKIKKAVIEDYIKGLSKGNSPQMIGSGGSTQPSATPADKTNNFKEASDRLRAMLQN